MGDDPVRQAIAELQNVVRCRCYEGYKERGLHDPDCHCDSAEAVTVVADRIEQLEAENVALRNALQHEKERKRRAVDDALAHLRQDTGE